MARCLTRSLLLALVGTTPGQFATSAHHVLVDHSLLVGGYVASTCSRQLPRQPKQSWM
jgi:hypothetical protein